ncbi:MAG: LuxR family transcriptional regulator [Ilumatobacteraceae bacterium]
MMGPIGRDAEREVAATFVAAAVSGSAVLEIEGDAGIGKTTLCRFTVETARLAGSRVLVCGLTEAEAALSFAGLTDLLRDIEPEWFELLPAPQRHALAVATLRTAPTADAVDERTIGTALATLLTVLADRAPVIVAIDDAQWLDQATAHVVRFALRRLGARSLGIVTCRRPGMADQGFTAGGGTPAWERMVTVRGLTAAALFHIVRVQQGITLARPMLLRITETAQGNPFLALELSRANAARGGTGASAALPMTASMQLLVNQRIESLTGKGRDALLAAACAVQPTLALLTQLGLRVGIEEAEAAHVVSIDRGRVLFDHPLLSAAVVQSSSGSAIRAVHATLGDASTDAEARARHYALANPDPDRETSKALDEAVNAAEARGALVAAAELARLALERTESTDQDAEWQRRLRLGKLLHNAGSAVEAGEVLANADRYCPSGPLRAEVNLVLTEVAYQTATTELALTHATAALAESGDDASLRARALLSLAVLTSDGHDKADRAAEALRCLVGSNVVEPSLRAWAALEAVSARFHLGEGLDCEELDRALIAERTGREWRSGDQVAAVRPVLLKWGDEHEAALAGLAELRERAEIEGNEGLLPYIVGHIPGIMLRLGRFEDAAAASDEHLSLSLSTGQEGQRMQALYNVALVDAHCGKLQQAEHTGHEMLDWSHTQGDQWVEMSACAVLGFTAMSGGDFNGASTWFDRWWVASEAEGLIDPGVTRFHGDHIESLLAMGATTRAVELTAILQKRATRAGRVSAGAVAARCRALLAATAGDHGAALAFAEDAIALHHECPIEFDLARTLLVTGIIHRRAKEKAAAKQSLGAAHEIFIRLGADAFRDRAAAELGRVGTRVAMTLELTATEQLVAELAASGLTNRQVAERGFISPKTVEANLVRIYRKLGITSRAELGAKMLQRK